MKLHLTGIKNRYRIFFTCYTTISVLKIIPALQNLATRNPFLACFILAVIRSYKAHKYQLKTKYLENWQYYLARIALQLRTITKRNIAITK